MFMKRVSKWKRNSWLNIIPKIIMTSCQTIEGLWHNFKWERTFTPCNTSKSFLWFYQNERPATPVLWHAHSPAPHTQTSFSLGSPAVCTHSPVTPPESAASWFPPGCLPVEVGNTHHDDYRDRHMCGSQEETLWSLWYTAIWGFSC